MNSKKAITLLVLATLIMSLVPILPVSAAAITAIEDTAGNGKATGVFDEVFVIKGNGVTSGDTINAYWDTVGASYLMNSTTGNPDGTFEVWVTVPSADNGNHYIWIKDVETGQTVSTGALVINSAVSLSNDEGLPGDSITVKGYGFEAEDDTIDVYIFNTTDAEMLAENLEADEDGYWSTNVDIPSWWYADNTTDTFYKMSGNGTLANATGFDIGPAISLDTSEGPSGTVVTVTGRGFTVDMVEGDITLVGGSTCPHVDGDITLNSEGGFTADVVIPNDAAGDYDLEVDDGAYSATADFEILGNCAVSASPAHGAPGETVTIMGYNFTQIDGTDVDVQIGAETVAEDVNIDSNGEFSVDVVLPALTLNEQHDVTATDDYGLAVTEVDEVLIGVVTMLLSDYSGVAGQKISLTATGLKGNDDYNISIGDVLIYENVAYGGVTAIQKDIYVPDLAPGVYTIELTDGGWGITVSIDFEVTAGISVTLTPAGAPNEYNVSIYAENWPEVDDKAITWNLYNDTDLWDISASVYDVWGGGGAGREVAETNASGWFNAFWVVPEGTGTPAELEEGTYYINATIADGAVGQDGGDWTVEAMFSIVPEEWDISIKKSTYAVGDTITFNIRATFEKDGSVLTITDPEGYVHWEATFGINDWVSVGDWQTVPVGYQLADTSLSPFVLSEDAPLGTWEWEIVDGDETLESGTFVVGEAQTDVVSGQVEDLANQLDELSSDLSDVTGEFADVQSSIADVAAVAADAVAAAEAAANAVTAVAGTANEAATAAADAAAAAESAREAASGLTTLVYGAIGAALVAALAAIVSLMQISRRIAG